MLPSLSSSKISTQQLNRTDLGQGRHASIRRGNFFSSIFYQPASRYCTLTLSEPRRSYPVTDCLKNSFIISVLTCSYVSFASHLHSLTHKYKARSIWVHLHTFSTCLQHCSGLLVASLPPPRCGASATPPPDSVLIFAWHRMGAPHILILAANLIYVVGPVREKSHSRDFVFDFPANAQKWWQTHARALPIALAILSKYNLPTSSRSTYLSYLTS